MLLCGYMLAPHQARVSLALIGTAESPRKPLRHSSHAPHYTEGRAKQALAEWLEVKSSWLESGSYDSQTISHSVLCQGHTICLWLGFIASTVEGANEEILNRTRVCHHHSGTIEIIPGVWDLDINSLFEAEWLKFLKSILRELWKKRTNPRTRDFWGKLNYLGRNSLCHDNLAARKWPRDVL